jgi:GTP-binding protein EngB required for normal cell division
MALAKTDGIETFARLAAEAKAPQLADEARGLAQRVVDGLFYVACVGQFKRGKSSLLNAVVGAPVLPVGVLPITAVVTVVRYGEAPGARLRFQSGRWQNIELAALATYVSEDQNPENAKGVAAVEVFMPSPLLATGMCLVDTPGVGSVFVGNTAATKAFVPHIDAALVVLGADPPISAEELALVAEIAGQCRHLLVAMNKADKLSEREQQEARRFTMKVLADRLGGAPPPIFNVSAAERLAGSDGEREWPGLLAALEELARQSGSDLVEAAEKRELALLTARLQRLLDEEYGALQRPVAESERRVAALRACADDAERSLSDLDPLFTAEQARLGRKFIDLKERFLDGAWPETQREFAAALPEIPARYGPALRQQAIELAYDIAEKRLNDWLKVVQPTAESLYIETTQRFVDLTNDLLNRLAASGDGAPAELPRALNSEAGFRVRSRLFYGFVMAWAGQTPAAWILDVLRCRDRQLRVLDREIGTYLHRLLNANAGRIEGDFNERVLESRRRLQAEIRKQLREVVGSAAGALDAAKELRAQGAEAVQRDVERLTFLRNCLTDFAAGKTAPQ